MISIVLLLWILLFKHAILFILDSANKNTEDEISDLTEIKSKSNGTPTEAEFHPGPFKARRFSQ